MTQCSVRKRFGVVDDGQKQAMSGLEFVQGLVNGTLPLNPMAETWPSRPVATATAEAIRTRRLRQPAIAEQSAIYESP